MEKMKDMIKHIGEIERKIIDGEALYHRTETASRWGWFFLGVGTVLIIIGLYSSFSNPSGVVLGLISILFGVLMLLASILRLDKAEQFKKEIEDGLREYKGQKAELQAEMTLKK